MRVHVPDKVLTHSHVDYRKLIVGVDAKLQVLYSRQKSASGGLKIKDINDLLNRLAAAENKFVLPLYPVWKVMFSGVGLDVIYHRLCSHIDAHFLYACD
jgi:hypothetical protein